MKDYALAGMAVLGLIVTGVAGIMEGGCAIIGSAMAFGILLYVMLH